MDTGYEDALRALARSYETAVNLHGGRSLSRVATIVASSGAFFDRLHAGKTFTVHNLERFADWFRNPVNWPKWTVPDDAQAALLSIGRPAFSTARLPHEMPNGAEKVACDRRAILNQSVAR